MLIVVNDSLVGTCSNARFHPASVAGVVLRGYDVGTEQLGVDDYLGPFGVGTYHNC